EMQEFQGELLECRTRLVEHRLVATDKERQLALIGAGGTAGHAAIEIFAAGGLRGRDEPRGVVRRGCGEIAKDLSRTRRGKKTALSRQHILDLRRGRHDEDDDVAGGA